MTHLRAAEEDPSPTRTALLVVDAMSDFQHEDGDALLASFRCRVAGFDDALADARRRNVPVIYVNDRHDCWSGDARAFISTALAGKGSDVISVMQPQTDDPFLFKSRYSAFDHTDLALLLEQLRIGRVILIGAATERCLVQTAIDAREMGLQATILAQACATVDQEMEALALLYAQEVVGATVVRSGNLDTAYD